MMDIMKSSYIIFLILEVKTCFCAKKIVVINYTVCLTDRESKLWIKLQEFREFHPKFSDPISTKSEEPYVSTQVYWDEGSMRR